MNRLVILLSVLVFGLTLAACGSTSTPAISPLPTSTDPPVPPAISTEPPAPPSPSSEPTAPPPTPTELPSPLQAATEQASSDQPTEQPLPQDMTRSDSQGAITVEVTPINLVNPEDTIVFEIGLTTHSIDLSMDLATLATLSTDAGRTVEASFWDAPRGGHHVSGKLSFPASIDGKLLLDGALELTLTIKDLDAPERIFTWKLEN